MREKIIEKRESARRLEWELQIKECQAAIKRNQFILDKKRQEKMLEEIHQQELCQQAENLALTMGKTLDKHGENPKNLNSAIDLNSQLPSMGVNANVNTLTPAQPVYTNLNSHEERVADWVSEHSYARQRSVNRSSGNAIMAKNSGEIQQKAQCIIDKKKAQRKQGDIPELHPVNRSSHKLELGMCPLKGVEHL